MRILVLDITVKKDKDGYNYYWVVGRLQSGIEIIIRDIYYDLRECIGHHIEVLISFMRSPYCELQRGIQNQIFLKEEFYSVELIDELLDKKGAISPDNEGVIVLTGRLISSYIIPERWVSFTQRKLFKILFKNPSALRTKDGAFLLYPFHLQRQIPIDQIPQEVTMAGSLRLEAWTRSQ